MPYLYEEDETGHKHIHPDKYEFLVYRLFRNRIEAGDGYVSDSLSFRSFSLVILQYIHKFSPNEHVLYDTNVKPIIPELWNNWLSFLIWFISLLSESLVISGSWTWVGYFFRRCAWANRFHFYCHIIVTVLAFILSQIIFAIAEGYEGKILRCLSGIIQVIKKSSLGREIYYFPSFNAINRRFYLLILWHRGPI